MPGAPGFASVFWTLTWAEEDSVRVPTEAGPAFGGFSFPSGPAFKDLLQVSLPVQNGDHLQRDSFRAIDDHVVRKFRDGPETHGYRSDVLPLGSHPGMFRQPVTGGKNFPLHPVGGVPIVFRDNPPNGVEVFRGPEA